MLPLVFASIEKSSLGSYELIKFLIYLEYDEHNINSNFVLNFS